MKFHVLGCSHHQTPLAVRELLAFSPDEVKVVLNRWLERYTPYEVVLLSTCNRTELYLAETTTATSSSSSPLSFPSKDELCQFLLEMLASEKTIVAANLPDYLYWKTGKDALEHLFSVAASLDSMVLGETQILSQVKKAYQLANEAGTTGPVTHTAFQNALNVAKQIATQTEIHQNRLSIPGVAISDFVLRIFDRLTDKRTLVLGAGEMAEETLRYLKEHGSPHLTVSNRSYDRAVSLAENWGGTAVHWENRWNSLLESDLVICTTGASVPVLRLADFQNVMAKRLGKPIVLLDLAVPRDVEPVIGTLPDVFLYTLDDLQKTCEENRQKRNSELPKAQNIIRYETERVIRDVHHRKTSVVLQRLRTEWEKTKEEELQRLFGKLPQLDTAGQETVRNSFDRLVNKLLHPPMESLRDESRHGVPQMLLDALTRLFRLND